MKGVGAVVINPNGHVVASHADFDKNGFGGFSLNESQKIRVRTMIAYTFFKQHTNQWLHQADEYLCREFLEHAQKCGYKVEYFDIDTEA